MKKKLVIRKGFCGCGCGGRTKRSDRNAPERGVRKGDFLKFINYHQHIGKNHHSWNGGLTNLVGKYNYVSKLLNDRHGGRILEHIEIVEKVLGKPLPDGAQIHHVNECCTDNRHQNLVICENQKYHALLHIRTRALRTCGNANWVKCKYCKKYDDPKHNMNTTDGGSPYHRECQNNLRRGKRGKK